MAQFKAAHYSLPPAPARDGAPPAGPLRLLGDMSYEFRQRDRIGIVGRASPAIIFALDTVLTSLLLFIMVIALSRPRGYRP